MARDDNSAGDPNRDPGAPAEDHALQYWRKALGLSEQGLQDMAAKAGVHAARVREALTR